jgi:hypothetical protein
MRYIKLVSVCLTAIFGVCLVATGATAAGVYKIDGIELEAGETLVIEASAKTEFIFKAKGALEIEAVVKCKKLKLKESEEPEVIGGGPGTSAKEVIEFEECSATLGGAKCEKVTVEGASLNNELVTIVLPSGKKGGLATLFTPASGKVFIKSKLTKCGIFGTQAATVEGTTAAATSPEGVFEPEGEWAWSETEEITEIEKANGTKEKVGVTSNGKKFTLQGAAQVKLLPSVIVLPKKWKFKKLGAPGKRVFNIINATPVAEEVRAGKINPNENVFKIVGGNGCYEKKIYLIGAACPVTIQAEAANGNGKFEIVPLRFPVFEATLES